MKYRDEANQIIVRVESSLRRLLELALADRSYADVAYIASLADALSEILHGSDERAKARQGEVRREDHDDPTRRRRRVTRESSKASKRTARAYPRFERDDNKLVKVGWSKKARTEYEHRAPREAVAAFAEHLSSKVKAGKTFVIEDLLPVPDSAGRELPSYQVYLALAWLRQTGVIEKKGRDGYALHDGMLAEDSLNRLWEELPEHSGQRRGASS